MAIGGARGTLTAMAFVTLALVTLAIADRLYAPEAPPRVYDYRCEASENDPDADCIFGVAGTDYPTLHSVPNTNFNCQQLLPGIYADPESACQVYHMCLHGGAIHSFLCPNGTVFSQEYFICDLWFNVDCSQATKFYSLNEHIYKDPEPKDSSISYA